jgi:hypothetical protein
MLPDNEALILFKFGKYKWMKKIHEGEISFSCPGSYIDIAIKEGNDEQGDINEGIFARLKKGNPKIKEMASKLKDDLEIIEDGDYVKLRRKSTYFIPTFCFYTFKPTDVLKKDINGTGWQKFRHDFDERMYSGFSLEDVTTLIIQPEPFKNQVQDSLSKQNIKFKTRHINYTEFEKEEFFIEPTDNRDELFYKYPKYAYQNETRVCLLNNSMNNIEDRFPVNIGDLGEDCHVIRQQFYYEFMAYIGERV